MVSGGRRGSPLNPYGGLIRNSYRDTAICRKVNSNSDVYVGYSQCMLALETSIVSDRVDSRLRGNDDLKTNAC